MVSTPEDSCVPSEQQLLARQASSCLSITLARCNAEIVETDMKTSLCILLEGALLTADLGCIEEGLEGEGRIALPLSCPATTCCIRVKTKLLPEEVTFKKAFAWLMVLVDTDTKSDENLLLLSDANEAGTLEA